MSIYTMEKLESICATAAEGAKRKDETMEVQVCLKGYDLKRDKKFDGSVVLPFQKRKNERVLVVGDRNLEEMAKEAGLPFVLYDDVAGKTKEKKTMKKKFAENYHAVITTNTFHKYFEIAFLNRKRTPFYIFDPNGGNLKKFHDEVLRTVKFKLRQTNVVSFPVGTLEMNPAEISQNIRTGLDFLFTLLKKGVQNIDTISLKTTQGKPLRLC
uniref:60S ribosomal protein L10a n=1 Tax=Antonospora locustae TaxID=278021 RepID=Q6E4P9_ANTLO|nr:60S ribosomal protein L10a [Antonospora locustae]|eukprot:jgi/Antlo1/766/596